MESYAGIPLLEENNRSLFGEILPPVEDKDLFRNPPTREGYRSLQESSSPSLERQDSGLYNIPLNEGKDFAL